MSSLTLSRVTVAEPASPIGDLFKITKAKSVVGVSPNTVRTLFAHGLPYYKLGRLVMVSRSEFEALVKSGRGA